MKKFKIGDMFIINSHIYLIVNIQSFNNLTNKRFDVINIKDNTESIWYDIEIFPNINHIKVIKIK